MIFEEPELDQFIRDGYVLLRNGFSPDLAAEGRAFILNELGLSPGEDPASNETMIHIQQAFTAAPFDRILNSRIVSAVDELTGEGRAHVIPYYGWWPVLFPGLEGPGGGHVDGSNFHHRLTSREQGLVTLYLFSDIEEVTGKAGDIAFLHPLLIHGFSANRGKRLYPAVRAQGRDKPRASRWRVLAR
jgi:hypothetical protein